MKPSLKRLVVPAILILGIGTYILVAGRTGFCPACSAITDALGLSGQNARTRLIPPEQRTPAPTWSGIDLNGNPVSSVPSLTNRLGKYGRNFSRLNSPISQAIGTAGGHR